VTLDMRMVYRRHLTLRGEVGATTAMIREVWQAVAERRLAPPPVCHTFALADVAAAHEAAAGRDLCGRAVLVVGDPGGAPADRASPATAQTTS
jgi:NADPH:quinone reductase-like Zn-dependent oxidoreductase